MSTLIGSYSYHAIIVMCLVILFSYIIFGMVGFGTALISAPICTLYMPLGQLLGLLALLDMCSALLNLIRDGKKAKYGELKYLVPLMIVGSGIGYLLLITLDPQITLLFFGIFTIAYALYALLYLKPLNNLSVKHAVPFGISGGIFGMLFGSGGFLFALYLSGRIEHTETIRVTQTTVIGCNTILRVILFGVAGIYFSANYFALTCLLLPSTLIGSYIGKKIISHLSKEQFVKIINSIILFSGLAIILKYYGYI